MSPSPAWRERLRPYGPFLLFAGLVLALFHDALGDGFDNDGLGYAAYVTRAFADHPWLPFVNGNDPGHPLLTFWPVALVWRLAGFGTWSAHLAVFLFAAMALAAARELVLLLLPERLGATRTAAGWLAPLALLAHPVFAAYTVQYLAEVPSTALTLALLIAVLREDRPRAALWGSLLCLTKLTGFVTIAACVAAELVRGRRRSPAERLRSLLPHAVGLGLLALYLGVKLVVLRLPLTTFPKNASWFGPGTILTERLPLTLRSLVDYPPWATGLWLLVLAVACGAALLRKKPLAPATGNSWSGTETGLLLLAVAAANVALLAANGNFPQPRYLLPVQGVIVTSGVAALAWLLGERGRSILAATTLAWIGLALLRWKSEWLHPVERLSPRAAAALRMPPLPEVSLDVRRRIAFVKRLHGELMERTPATCVHGLYPTSSALHEPYAGYGPGRRNPGGLHWFPTYTAFREVSDRKLREGACPGGRFVVICSWDSDGERYRAELRGDRDARLLRTETPLPGTWADVYALTSPPATTGPPAASRGSSR